MKIIFGYELNIFLFQKYYSQIDEKKAFQKAKDGLSTDSINRIDFKTSQIIQ